MTLQLQPMPLRLAKLMAELKHRIGKLCTSDLAVGDLAITPFIKPLAQIGVPIIYMREIVACFERRIRALGMRGDYGSHAKIVWKNHFQPVEVITDEEKVELLGELLVERPVLHGMPYGIIQDVEGDQALYTVDVDDEGRAVAHKICNFLRLLSRTVDESGNINGYIVEFEDAHRKLHERVIAASDLASDSTAVFRELADDGFVVEASARPVFRRLLQAWEIDAVTTVFSRPGWHGHAGQTLYVTACGEIITADGNAPATPCRLAASATVGDICKAGTLEEWQRRIGNPIWDGSTPQFAIGAVSGLAGVVAQLYSGDGFGLYFWGTPSSGKSITQLIGAGTIANPGFNKDQRRVYGTRIWAGCTADELADTVRKATASGLHIEEVQDGARGFIVQLGYDCHDWRGTVCTVSGVAPLATLVTAARSDTGLGIEVRLLSIDVGSVPRVADVARIQAIGRAALECYGHALPVLVRHVMSTGLHRDLAALRAAVDAYAAQLATDGSDADATRAARHFGVLALTGELMTDAGLAPETADVDGAIRWAWQCWNASRKVVRLAAGTDPVDAAIAALDELADRVGGDGVIKNDTGQRVGCVDPTGTIHILSKQLPLRAGVTPRAIVDALRSRGRLIEPQHSSAKSRRLVWTKAPGWRSKNESFYRIRRRA